MYVKFKFTNPPYPALYNDYCQFLFESMKKSVIANMDLRKYKLREPLILSSSVIDWKYPQSRINLTRYLRNCLELVKENGIYVVRVNPRMVIRNSRTKVSTLIRLLEYGNEKIPPLPLLRTIFQIYRDTYPDRIVEFIESRW